MKTAQFSLLFAFFVTFFGCFSDFTDRILRGQDAPKEKYLFTVKLVISGGNLNESLCTGTVISKHHVMTAAHCLIFQEWDWFMDIFYSINANNITMIKRDGSTMFSNKFYAGPRFTAKTVLQDIGIVEFVDEIGIEPVALAAEFDEYDGQIAVVLGYGNTTAHRIGPFPGYPEGMIIGINPPKTLQCACIGIRNFKACKEFYESYDNFTMPPMVCAGDRNQGIMSGDSGGPLLLQNITGKWIQVGITSFRQFLFDEHDVYPDAFTRISTHCKWIKKVTKNKSKCETFKPVKLLDDEVRLQLNDTTIRENPCSNVTTQKPEIQTPEQIHKNLNLNVNDLQNNGRRVNDKSLVEFLINLCWILVLTRI